MKKRFFICLFFVLCAPRMAAADILEVKGEGFVNGKIVSENDQELTFKNTAGQVRVLQRSDILFIEKEDKGVFKKDFWADAAGLQGLYYKTIYTLRDIWARLRRITNQLTERWIGAASKPLDRSRANARAAALP